MPFQNTMLQAINSLVELMKLMGKKYITLVKMKVIGMLRLVIYIYVDFMNMKSFPVDIA